MAHSPSEEDDNLYSNLGFLLGKCSQIKDRFLDQHLLVEDITASQVKVLFSLYHMKVQRSSDISKALNLDSSSVTRMLDRLEKKGLIIRKSDPEDRRSVLIELTPIGTETTERATPLAKEAINQLTECLTPAEKQSLQHCLSKIVDCHIPEECRFYNKKDAQ